MSGRHQPLHGADSAEALRDVLPIACLTCLDRGWVIGGDEELTCPSCHGKGLDRNPFDELQRSARAYGAREEARRNAEGARLDELDERKRQRQVQR